MDGARGASRVGFDADVAGFAVAHRKAAPADFEFEHAAHVDAADQAHGCAGQQAQLHQATAKGAVAADRHQARARAGPEEIERGQGRCSVRGQLVETGSQHNRSRRYRKSSSPYAHRTRWNRSTGRVRAAADHASPPQGEDQLVATAICLGHSDTARSARRRRCRGAGVRPRVERCERERAEALGEVGGRAARLDEARQAVTALIVRRLRRRCWGAGSRTIHARAAVRALYGASTISSASLRFVKRGAGGSRNQA